jgi:VWFA-related protein
MKNKIVLMMVSVLVLWMAACMSTAAGESDIIQINGDTIDRSKSNTEITFKDFSGGVADVIITQIDSSAFPVIKVYVDVVDSFGVLVCGLSEEDFCLYQDLNRLDFELTSLDSVPCPVSVCLVMDVSGSMVGKPLQHAKDAAISFVRNMGPLARTAIVAYASCVELVQGFTSDTTLLINAINSMSAGGRTALFDGFWLGVDVTHAEPDIKAVIGFTDGNENNSQACWPPPDGILIDTTWSDDCDTVTSYAQAYKFPIYTIGLGPDAWPEPLICLAQNTGGQYSYAPSAEKLDSVYQQIQGRLCCRYLITYTSPDTVQDCDVHQVIVCEGGELCTPCDTAYYRELCPPVLKRTPPTIALSDTCQPPSQNLVIEAWATDSVPPPVQEVDLFWRKSGGGPAYTKIVMTHVSDSLYRGTIAGAALPPGTPGVDYYLTATDGDFTVSDPPENPQTSPYLIDICENQPPVLICPDDDSVHAGDPFTSTDYSVTDPDDPAGSIVVTLHSVSPTPTSAPGLVSKHVEWNTTCPDLNTGPVFTFTLVATDPHGAKDTCSFEVKVYNNPPQIECPQDDSVYAGGLFQSDDFSSSDPDLDQVTVSLCGITPTPAHQPTIVENHVQWQTECADAGKLFTICLKATDECGLADTCYFDVAVYIIPPEIVCPEDDSVHAGENFVSTDFSLDFPQAKFAPVSICGIDPEPVNQPSIVENHIEWQTDCDDAGKTFSVCLEATGDKRYLLFPGYGIQSTAGADLSG